jgi:ABC-type oligopeptide transport system substrate-binding subunit
LFGGAGDVASVRAVGVRPQALRQALQERDFELALWPLEYDDSLWPLVALFDPHAEALQPGGANVLGYANDAKLQSLLRTIQGHRDFAARRNLVHELHAHLIDTIPLIPLWQAPVHVALQPDVQVPPLDGGHLFARINEWKRK